MLKLVSALIHTLEKAERWQALTMGFDSELQGGFQL